MNAFSKIDMGEVTRLTQAGKLAEAMALLQGHPASSIARGSPDQDVPRSTARVQAPIAIVANDRHGRPVGSGWRLDGSSRNPSSELPAGPVRPVRAAATPDLAQTMLAFRDRLTQVGHVFRHR